MDYKIQENLLQGVINYLATKSYKEVAMLLNGLSKLEIIKGQTDKAKTEENKTKQ